MRKTPFAIQLCLIRYHSHCKVHNNKRRYYVSLLCGLFSIAFKDGWWRGHSTFKHVKLRLCATDANPNGKAQKWFWDSFFFQLMFPMPIVHFKLKRKYAVLYIDWKFIWFFFFSMSRYEMDFFHSHHHQCRNLTCDTVVHNGVAVVTGILSHLCSEREREGENKKEWSK